MVILLALLVIVLVALVLAGNFFFAFALKRPEGRAPAVPEDVAGSSEQTQAVWRAGPWLDESSEDVFLQSHDGLRLRAHYAAQEGHKYAIVVHGYTGTGRSMASFGEAFFDRGFTVLLPDCRAHGDSEGQYIGMGWLDRLDVLSWIDWIIARDPQAEILLHGISMGAATVMMTSGEALPEQVRLVIADCGYTSVMDEFTAQLKEQFGLPAFPFLQVTSLVTRLRAGYWLGDADAQRQVAKSTLPVLFIHGQDDTFVPFWMMDRLYDAKTMGVKERLAVPGAAHGMAAAVDPEGYWGAIDAFIEENF